jgi:hypothetical protein
MVPIFQEGFEEPAEGDEVSPALEALLQYNGLKLLDRQGIHVEHTIRDLATMINKTVGRPTQAWRSNRPPTR